MKLFSKKVVAQNKSWMPLVRLCIALILLSFLVASTGIKPILHNLLNINPLLAGALLLCNILLFLTGAINVWLLLNVMHSISFSTFIQAYSYSWMLSLLTPGQAGDISLLFFLKKYKVLLQHTGIAYALDKILTLVFFFFIAWYGSYNLIPELKAIWFPIFSVGLILLPLIFIIKKKFHLTISLTGKFQKIFNETRGEAKNFKEQKIVLILNLILTVMKWLVLSLCYMMAFYAFGAHVEWPDIGVIPILSTLVGYIPISVGGIGTVELTATHLFSKVGVEQSVVLSAYLLLRSMQYIMAIILLALFSSKNKLQKRAE
ncbi:MAG: UPF0104 family protein [Candidatus Electrothrix sp. AX2]|nr:UPF0104 family protein [Candidatus Electrothrix gigas]